MIAARNFLFLFALLEGNCTSAFCPEIIFNSFFPQKFIEDLTEL